LAAIVALLAVPGFALKQFINFVQLRSAMQQLAGMEKLQGSAKKQRTQEALDALSKMQ
jgi:CDP-diacylglycerol--inositol 3-phosphatidyltransferase